MIGICKRFSGVGEGRAAPGYQRSETHCNAYVQRLRPLRMSLVTLVPQSQTCVWTRDLTGPIYCPVAHGEGRFALADRAKRPRSGLVARFRSSILTAMARLPRAPILRIPMAHWQTSPRYAIRGLTVLGLMPHPEDHIYGYQHPRWTRGQSGRPALAAREWGALCGAAVRLERDLDGRQLRSRLRFDPARASLPPSRPEDGRQVAEARDSASEILAALPHAIGATDLPLAGRGSGKVRDWYSLDDGRRFARHHRSSLGLRSNPCSGALQGASAQPAGGPLV